MVARVALLVVLSCACNRVYGLGGVESRDAQVFDTPTDTPFGCPPIGADPPAFSPLLHQVGSQRCLHYGVVAGRAVALCTDGHRVMLSEGPADGVLDEVAAPPSSVEDFYSPQFTPNALEIYANVFNYDTTVQYTASYNRTQSGWMRGPDVAWAAGASGNFGHMALGPDGVHVVVTDNLVGSAIEWVRDSSGWRVLRDQPNLLVPDLVPTAEMTDDGLRVVLHSTAATYYSDRDNIDGEFGPARLIASAPNGDVSLLSFDCSRLYVGGLGATFYVQQQ